MLAALIVDICIDDSIKSNQSQSVDFNWINFRLADDLTNCL